MMSHLVRAGLLALVCAGATSHAATARTVYDGQWSVLIVTDHGNCDRAYRYGIQIVNGVVRYNGGGANLSGRVSSGGAVRVNLSSGGSAASGSGRLTRDGGGGTWRGHGSVGACSGNWSAERRG